MRQAINNTFALIIFSSAILASQSRSAEILAEKSGQVTTPAESTQDNSKAWTLELLSGIEDGFGLGITFAPPLGEDFKLNFNANLVTNPDDSDLDVIRGEFRYSPFGDLKVAQSSHQATDSEGKPILGPDGIPWIVNEWDSLSLFLSSKASSTQDFENLDYGLGLGLHWHSLQLRDNPYSPFHLIQNIFDALGANSPRIEKPKGPDLAISYHLVRSDLEDADSKNENRVSAMLEATWEVPVADLLTVVYESAYDVDDGNFHDFIVAKLSFYEFKKGVIGDLEGNFALFYKYGELAPTFETGKEIGLGFSLKL